MSLSSLSKHLKSYKKWLSSFASVVFVVALFSTSTSQAQVILDGSLGGPSGAVGSGSLPNGQTLSDGATTTDHLITHDLGTTVGNNLFHSFTELSIGAGKSATFTGPDSIANILSRVTGTHASQIDGTLASTIDNANLFLLNPNGVIFGENATLDIKGSFYASNADYIQLEDGDRFYASLDKNTVLTAAAPEAFGFLGATPPMLNADTQSTMRVEGLTVVNGDAVTLVGRDAMTGGDIVDGIIIRGGTFEHQNGQINLVSIGSAQAPAIEQIAVYIDTLSAQGLNAQSDVIANPVQLGTMTIDQGAHINTSGYGGGTIVLRGGQLTIEDAQISANVTGSDVGEIGNGIDIEMTDDVMITRSRLQTNVTGDSESGISSGGIHMKANALTQSFSLLQSKTESTGHAGNIDLNIKKSLNVGFSTITTDSFSSGNAGNINVLVENSDLSLTDSSAITTQSFANGNAGKINIAVEKGDVIINNFSAVFSRINGNGTGGSIDIRATNMKINSIAAIAVVNFSQQQAEGVNISLSGDLSLSKTSFIDVISENSVDAADTTIRAKDISLTGESFITTETQGSGQGGNLIITADNLTLADESFITSEAKSSGNAGNINIELTDSFSANTGGKVIASTSATGNGGNITISANNLNLTEGGTITAESTSIKTGAGVAGDINLTATQSIHMTDSTVSTKAENALGGNIKLTAEDMIQITNSNVTSQVLEGSESAGKITIDPDFVIIQNSNILSTAVSGDGGPITIIANLAVLVDPFSNVDASSQFGGNGTIDIRAPIQQLSEAIGPLPEDIVKAAALYAEACASQKSGQFSSMVKNADSTPAPAPGGFLLSPLAFNESRTPLSTTQAHVLPDSALPYPSRMQALFEKQTWNIHEQKLPPVPLQSCSHTMG